MAKVFLTCFTPFKPSSTDELAVGLFSSMVIDLQQLQKSLDENPLSLRWCSEAISVIKKTHARFLLGFESSEVSAAWEAVRMFDEYMSATLDLLDLCNLLKSAISSLDRYRLVIDFMVQRSNDVIFSTTTSMTELERLERENYNKFFDAKKLREMNHSKEGVSKVKLKTRNNMNVLQAIKSTMSIVSLLIFCSILHPIPVKINEGFYFQSCNLDPSSDIIQKLVTSFEARFQNAQGSQRPVLLENEMIEDAFSELKGQVASTREVSVNDGNVARSLEILKKRSLALKEGLDLLQCQVNELFENVIEGRKRVINLITFKNDAA